MERLNPDCEKYKACLEDVWKIFWPVVKQRFTGLVFRCKITVAAGRPVSGSGGRKEILRFCLENTKAEERNFSAGSGTLFILEKV